MDKNNNKRKILYLAIGNALEFYDFVLYGILATTFVPLFFPATNPALSVISAYVLFSIGFLLRPMGVFLWGHIADKYGRKPVLLITITLVSIPAVGIACLPTYDAIGIFAPILLLFFRSIQGLSYSGEMPTALACIYELSPKNRTVFYTGLMEVSAISGTILALLITILFMLLLPEKDFSEWGWRIPFMVSIIAIIFLSYIRILFVETLTTKNSHRFPVIQAIKTQWKSIIGIIFLIAPNCICFYSYTAYIPNVIKQYTEYTHLQSLIFSALSFFYILIVIFVASYLINKRHVKLILFIAISGMFISNFFIHYAIEYNVKTIYLILSILGIGLFLGMLYSVHLPLIVNQSDCSLRVSSVGLGVNISVVLFGGTAPLVNEYLTNSFNSNITPAIYFMLISLIALFCVYKMKNIK